MDLICDAIDSFNCAAKLANKVDAELEAISKAWLGKIFYKGLKNNKKARAHLFDCEQLASC
jgi:hypothetical protein